MRPGDATHSRQSEASASLRGCEKRIEDAGEIFLLDATPIIRDLDDGFFPGFCFTIALSAPDAR